MLRSFAFTSECSYASSAATTAIPAHAGDQPQHVRRILAGAFGAVFHREDRVFPQINRQRQALHPEALGVGIDDRKTRLFPGGIRAIHHRRRVLVPVGAVEPWVVDVEEDGLLDRAVQIGQRFGKRLSALQERTPLIREVRVKGAMIGIQLAADGTPVVQECLKRRLLINCTHSTVIRLLPAMNIADAEVDAGCTILEEVLLSQK